MNGLTFASVWAEVGSFLQSVTEHAGVTAASEAHSGCLQAFPGMSVNITKAGPRVRGGLAHPADLLKRDKD